MVKQGPPSPAPSNGGELQYGLHHLVQHNAATHYQPQQYPFEDAGYVQSGTNTSYGSPPSGHLMADQYGRVLYRGPYRESNDVGLGIQYVCCRPLRLASGNLWLINNMLRADMKAQRITKTTTVDITVPLQTGRMWVHHEKRLCLRADSCWDSIKPRATMSALLQHQPLQIKVVEQEGEEHEVAVP